MKRPTHTLFLFFIALLLAVNGYPQGEQPIERSIVTETIEGKTYYLHFVKKGETLFAIARAYQVTTNDIFKANPRASQGVVDGQILKIPRVEESQANEQEEAENQKNDFFYHIVKKQETFYGISRKYGVTIDEIKSINPELGDYPREGETLKIPHLDEVRVKDPENWEGPAVVHTVEQGETLYGIAKQYNVTIGEIKNANPGLPDVIRIGATITIPNQVEVEAVEIAESDAQETGSMQLHVVEPGETLYSIAKTYAISIDSMKSYNPGLTASLSPGQEISIPVAASTTEFIVHTPAKNQSLDGISVLYGVQLDELSRMNPEIRRKARKGQPVKIPVDPPEPEVVVNHAAEESEPEDALSHCFESDYHHNNVYNIALMLPLFLQEIDSIDFEGIRDYNELSGLVSFRFINFYGGFRMALDSMVNSGMKVNLFVYDVDNDGKKAEQVLLASELSSMDLIIGPFYLAPFRKVAEFARTYGIPIVNPLSKRDELILGNPYVYKIKPSEERQIDLLKDYLIRTYPTANIVLVRNNKYKYQNEISFIRNSLNRIRPTHTYIPNERILEACKGLEKGKTLFTENKVIDPAAFRERPGDSTYFSNLVKEVIYMNDSITGLDMNLSYLRPNIVVALSDDIVFSKELLSQLNKFNLTREITLFGLPAWNEFTDLETSHMLNLQLHTFSSSLVSYESVRIKNWIRKYRALYHTEPGEGNYAFDGFDAGWFFLNALYHYGRDFGDCLQYLSIPLMQTNFEFEQNAQGGFQNNYWNLGTYTNYRYRKVYVGRD